MKISGVSWKSPSAFILIPFLCFMLSAGLVFASEEGGGGGGLTVIPDWTTAIQIANFLFLIWVLNLILYRPIRRVLLQRKDKITGLEQSIQSESSVELVPGQRPKLWHLHRSPTRFRSWRRTCAGFRAGSPFPIAPGSTQRIGPTVEGLSS